MKVRFSAIAEAELEDIADHIGIDAPERAIGFVMDLRARCASLSDFPRRFPLVPGYEHRGLRRFAYGNYLIFYRVDDAGVGIAHVLHGHRDYAAILDAE